MCFNTLGRREFITLLGGAAAMWPIAAAHAQQPDRMRRIGVFAGSGAEDLEAQPRLAAFLQGLQQLGWTDGRNVRIDYRWARGQCRPHSQIRGGIGCARAGRHPGRGHPGMWRPLLQATRTVPIVFVIVVDPVGAGFVDSLARPGGNATGFMPVRIQLEREMAGAAQRDRAGVTRAAVLRDAAITAGIGQFAAIQSVAPSFGVEVSPIDVRDAAEIERAITAFARSSNGGLIVTASALSVVHRDLIITLAARHRLPAVYF